MRQARQVNVLHVVVAVCIATFMIAFLIVTHSERENDQRLQACKGIGNEVTRATCINGHLP